MTGTMMTQDTKDKIAQLRGERGWSCRRIEIITGVKKEHIAWHCLANGIDSPKLKEPPAAYNGPMVVMRSTGPMRRFTAEEDQQMLELRRQGKGYHAVGKIMGRAHNSIKMRLATLARRDERKDTELCQPTMQ